jgi:hypothetical protein
MVSHNNCGAFEWDKPGEECDEEKDYKLGYRYSTVDPV